MRYLLIHNPASGGGRGHPRVRKVVKWFARHRVEVQVYETRAPGDATHRAREAAGEGYDLVIAAGGDGTIREVVAGLCGTPVALGILPWGTGNVFAREMDLPRRTKALCRVIHRGHRLPVDLGSADGRPFLLMLSGGLDAAALGRTGVAQKRRWGLAAYAWAGLAALVGYRHPLVEVRLDEGPCDRGTFVLVCNTRLYGAYFRWLPQADPTDGALDVFVFRHQGRWAFLGMALQLVWHNLAHPRSSRGPGFLSRHGVYRTTGLTLVGPGLPAQIDGDPLADSVRRVQVLPGSLTVVLPKRTVRSYARSPKPHQNPTEPRPNLTSG